MKTKNLLKIIFIIVILIVIVRFGWDFINIKSEKSETENQKNQENILLTEFEEVQIKEEIDNYSIDVKYPEFSNISNIKAITDANSALKNKIEDSIASFKENIVQDAKKELSTKNILDNDYKISLLTNNVVSIQFSNYYYIVGMTHPGSYNEGFNYDFKNNKEIKLIDLFNLDVDYLSVLSTACRENLKKQISSSDYYSEDMTDSGTEPKDYNFSNFVFTKDALTITFFPSQVAPYVAGIQEISIPLVEMADYNNKSELIKLITE